MTGYVALRIQGKEEEGTLNMTCDVVPYDEDIKLDQMQAVVGGYIERMFTIRTPDPDRVAEDIELDGWVNEEGLIYNLPVVAAIHQRGYPLRPFAGSLLITASARSKNPEDGRRAVPMTEREIAYIQEGFSANLFGNGWILTL